MPKKTESSSALTARESDFASGMVLDTHALIWMLAGDARLKKSARGILDQAAKAEGLFVPAISIWEIGMLEAKGRLSFPGGTAAWVRRALMLPGLNLAALEPEIALAAANLVDFHGDPADRLIAATAIHLGFPLATADHKIRSWGDRGHLRILSVG